MTPHFSDDSLSLYLGDCVEVMAGMEAESVDAIVTDPPYGLGFMGKAWDGTAGPGGLGDMPMRRRAETNIVNTGVSRQGGRQRSTDDFAKRQARDARSMQTWHERWAREALRVAKPGAHLLAFGGTRTYHRLASAIEDAGWEIRDCLVWAYASGFPKSLDMSKAIDKAAGAEREAVAVRTKTDTFRDGDRTTGGGPDHARSVTLTAPATPEAGKWQGWGTALKPAWEPIVLARKPLRGTVARNVTEYGTGALNIDGTRIGTTKDIPASPSRMEDVRTHGKYGPTPTDTDGWNSNIGRWPANVVLTDPIFDGGMEGVSGGGEAASRPSYLAGTAQQGAIVALGGGIGKLAIGERYVGYDEPPGGTYSRFFLIPKADRADREPNAHALYEMEPESRDRSTSHTAEGRTDPFGEKFTRRSRRANHHPTVKPVDLMRHLVRLVTPPGGVVLDPFVGSGSTLLAAEMEGFRSIGIEKEAEYVAIAQARLRGVQRGLGVA